MNLRIVLLGNFEGRGDEGFRNISQSFRLHFSFRYQVLTFNTTQALKINVIQEIISFRPHILHYLSGPTFKSLLILKLYKIFLGESVKIVVSATRPFFRNYEKKLLSILKPSIVLTQATKWEKVFKNANMKTKFIPNPINYNKFRKLNISSSQLRKKYALPINKKLILHVGHIRSNRNLELLGDIQSSLIKQNIQIVIVGSTHFPPENSLLKFLKEKGCIVLLGYIEKIEEIYNACDIYVFPVKGLAPNIYPKTLDEVGVVDMPLSILEALACELPIISTPIDSIGYLLDGIDNPPVYFFDGTLNGFEKGINEFNYNKLSFEKIKLKINSKNVFKQVDLIYKKLVGYNE